MQFFALLGSPISKINKVNVIHNLIAAGKRTNSEDYTEVQKNNLMLGIIFHYEFKDIRQNIWGGGVISKISIFFC